MNHYRFPEVQHPIGLEKIGGTKAVMLDNIKAVVFDFDGTLAVLNIDFASMRERVLDWMNQMGIEKESVKEKYLLEMIDEAYWVLLKSNPSKAEEFYERAHQILYEVELKAAEEGRLLPKTEATLNFLREKGIKIGIVTRNCEDAVRKVFVKIDQFCDVFISRNSVRMVKPHPTPHLCPEGIGCFRKRGGDDWGSYH